jgi:dinuclear metal center YbgI/SA1388 family protein
MPTIKVDSLVGALNKLSPFEYAEQWDNVGFLAGDASQSVTGIVVAVNLGPEALAACEKHGANVIVCHHPPIFKPISKLTSSSSPFLFKAIQSGINIISLHTNFDLSSEKVSKELAPKLGVKFSEFLTLRGGGFTSGMRQALFTVFVPEENLDQVRESICAVGAGQIGDYSQCTFSWRGEGTFLGGESTHPKIGKAGGLERTKEYCLRVVSPMKLIDKVVAAARKVHPYEEMAFDVLELARPTTETGYGFIGEDQSTNLVFHKVLENVKETFQLASVTVSGPGLDQPQMKVKRLAFSPGSGSAFMASANIKGADVYICGELGYHQMLEARQKGLTLVLLGHSYSERFFIEAVAEWCGSFGSVHKIYERIHDVR